MSNASSFIRGAVAGAVGIVILGISFVGGIFTGQNGLNGNEVSAGVSPVTSTPELVAKPAYSFVVKDNKIFYRDNTISWDDFLGLVKDSKQKDAPVELHFDEATNTYSFQQKVNNTMESLDVVVRRITMQNQ